MTDDNKELAANLRREVQQQQQQTKSRPTATSKSRKQGSELGSGRGSEERHSSVPAGGRGTKRGRDNDIEKVSPCFVYFITPFPFVGCQNLRRVGPRNAAEEEDCRQEEIKEEC